MDISVARQPGVGHLAKDVAPPCPVVNEAGEVLVHHDERLVTVRRVPGGHYLHLAHWVVADSQQEAELVVSRGPDRTTQSGQAPTLEEQPRGEWRHCSPTDHDRSQSEGQSGGRRRELRIQVLLDVSELPPFSAADQVAARLPCLTTSALRLRTSSNVMSVPTPC